MSESLLKAETREITGKEFAKKLRKQGKVPGIFYAHDQKPIPIVLDERETVKLLGQKWRESSVSEEEMEQRFLRLGFKKGWLEYFRGISRSFVADSLDRRKVGGTASRKDSKKDANKGGDAKGQENGSKIDGGGEEGFDSKHNERREK